MTRNRAAFFALSAPLALLGLAAPAAVAQTAPAAPPLARQAPATARPAASPTARPYQPSGQPPAAGSTATGTAQTRVVAATPPAPIALRPEQVAVLHKTLAQAGAHGLDPRDFAYPAEALNSGDEATRADAEARLVAASLRYAKSVHSGRLPEDGFLNKWSLRPRAYDPRPEMARAVAEDRLQAWLDNLPPPYASYQDLRGGLATYRAIAARGGWPTVPAGAYLKLGATGPRVAALRARLAAEDPSTPLEGGAVYDQGLAEAVTRAQKRVGLKPDGEVGPPTLAALNRPVQERIDQIVANMERWRWLPPSLPAHRVQVNVAAAVMALFQDDQPVLTMRAATGKPGDETPMLASEIHSVVLNPPWNVPTSIANEELWPKERANPGYLARAGYKVISTGTSSRIVQPAGPTAALGLYKFDFDNSHSVYLHDTPSRGAFDRYARLLSHGCVRLQKPALLARAILAGDPNWTPEAIQAAVDTGKTQRVQLPERVAVYLLYWTAYVTPDGQVNFRDDPYGWDRELTRRLAALPPPVA